MIYYIIIGLVLLLALSIYININSYKKNVKYENVIPIYEKRIEDLESFIQTFSDNLSDIDRQLTAIDKGGMFEADDDVGFTFKTIKLIMGQLQIFNTNNMIQQNATKKEG